MKTEHDVWEFITDAWNEFQKLPMQKKYLFLVVVQNVTNYSNVASIYKKGTPIHVRGSLTLQ